MTELSNGHWKRLLKLVGGAGGVSLGNLLVAVILLRSVSADEYGAFALIIILQSLGNGISNALIGTPMMVLLNSPGLSENKILGYHKFNLIFCLVFAACQFIISWCLLADSRFALIIFVMSFLNSYRWFGKGCFNNSGKHSLAVRIDASLSIMLIMSSLILWGLNEVTLRNVALAVMFSNGISMLVFPLDFFAKSILAISNGRISKTHDGFNSQGRHALLGVVSAEAISNGHAYIVTAVAGPLAFSLISAVNLLFRPLDVTTSTLTQVERPRIRALITGHGSFRYFRLLSRVYTLNFVVYLLTVFISATLVSIFPTYLVPIGADHKQLPYVFFLFIGLYMLRILRNPASIYLQSANDFSALSKYSFCSAIVTLLLVLFFVSFYGAIWSLLGVLIGETVLVILLYNRIRLGVK